MARILALLFAGLYLSVSSPSPAQSTLDAGARLRELMFLALDHGIASIDKGGPLIPLVVTDVAGKRTLSRFAVEPYEKSVEEARAYASKLELGVRLYAIAYDGYITVAGVKYDAIIVHAAEREKGEAYLIAQRYRPAKAGVPFEIVGNPAYMGREPALFRNAP